MKVKLKVTEHGHKITLIDNKGVKHVQEWVRNDGGGFITTDESVDLYELVITEELFDAIDSINFTLMDISNAIETENAVEDYEDAITDDEDAITDDEDAITDDGHKLKRGDVFYSIAVYAGTDNYTPLRHTYPQDWGNTGGLTYFDRAKCIALCDERNTKKED